MDELSSVTIGRSAATAVDIRRTDHRNDARCRIDDRENQSVAVQDQSILAINDSTSPVIIDKMIALEQTVIQRLRWAAGANPLVQDVLVKFEIRQKERANEIDVGIRFFSDKASIDACLSNLLE